MDTKDLKPARSGKLKHAHVTAAPAKRSQKSRQTQKLEVDSDQEDAQGVPNVTPLAGGGKVFKGNKITGRGHRVQYGDVTHTTYQSGAIHSQGGVTNVQTGFDLTALRNARKRLAESTGVKQQPSKPRDSNKLSPELKQLKAELKKIQEAHTNTREVYDEKDPKSAALAIKDCEQRIKELDALEPDVPEEGKFAFLYAYLSAIIYNFRGGAEFSKAMVNNLETRFDEYDAATNSFKEVNDILGPIETSRDPYIEDRQKSMARKIYYEAKVDKATVDLVYAEDLKESENCSLTDAISKINIAEGDMKIARDGLKKMEKEFSEDSAIKTYLERAEDRLLNIAKLKQELLEEYQNAEESDSDDDSLLDDMESQLKL